MYVQWRNYEFDLIYDGQRWSATCQRSHKTKTRLCAGHWINGLNKRVTDCDFMDTMEARIRQHQHEMQPKVDIPPRQTFRAAIRPMPRAPLVPGSRSRGEGNRYE